MAQFVEITEDEYDDMEELVQKILIYGGKLMSCLENEKRKKDMYGDRMPMYDERHQMQGGYDRYGGFDRDMMGERKRMGMRDDSEMMGERNRNYDPRRMR